MSGKPVFKPYDQNQRRIIFGFEDMIPQGHMVRVVSQAVDQIDLSPLLSRYPGGGTSSYHLGMLLKVLFYAYADHIYSSRRIAKASRENIHFLWLTGNTPLDHMTINRFRSERMKGVIEEIFAQVLELLAEQGYVKLEETSWMERKSRRMRENTAGYGEKAQKDTRRGCRKNAESCLKTLMKSTKKKMKSTEIGTWKKRETGRK